MNACVVVTVFANGAMLLMAKRSKHCKKVLTRSQSCFCSRTGVVGTGRSPRAALEAEESEDLGGGGRFDKKHAVERRNMPGQFDWGPQRVCWVCQIATDWAGDDAIVKSMNTRVRHPNVVGDTNTVYGNVRRKYEKDGENLVDLNVWNENQAGLHTVEGTVTVALPSS